MLDDLFDSSADRSRDKQGKSGGGLLGRIGQLLEGDFDGERRQDAEDERDRYAASGRDNRSSRDDVNDDRDDSRKQRQPRKKVFDFDFGD